MSEPVTQTQSPAPASGSARAPLSSREFAIESARLLSDEKCESIVVLDVRGLSQVMDYVVIGTGTSDRQMRAVLHHVEDLGAANGFPPYRSHSDTRSAWLLADCVDVVVHLFEPNTRAYYDLEMLWGDAKPVDWSRPPTAVPPGRRRAPAKPKPEA